MATNSAIAASGSRVYVVWSRLAKYNYGPTDAFTLQFRSNANHGSGTWSAIKNLTTSGQIDAPSVAASGSYVYVGYTNAATGAVKLLISSDYGAHFHDSGLSMAPVTYNNGYGYWGFTALAAAGTNVGMAWSSGDTFTSTAWTSTNHAGAKADFTLSSGDVAGNPRVAALGNRIAFAIPVCAGGCSTGSVKARIWQGGTLGPDRTAATFSSGETFKRSYSVDVSLAGTGALGLAWSACRLLTCGSSESPAKGVDVLWRESTDNGASWKNPFTLQSSTGTTATGKLRRVNAYASITFLSTTRRVVVFDAYDGPFTKGNVLLRVGSGAP
jgi:hypothetical protein